VHDAAQPCARDDLQVRLDPPPLQLASTVAQPLQIVSTAVRSTPPLKSFVSTRRRSNPPLNPCSTTVTTDGSFSIRDYAKGLNVTLVTATSPIGTSWAEASLLATESLLIYFTGENGGFKPVSRTVPIIYRPATDSFGQATYIAAMALPTSDYPNPATAPKPEANDKFEFFPPQRFAAVSFSTAAIATDLQYAFACGQLSQWLSEKGLTPVSTGVWAQAWVTYSGAAAVEHVQECWLGLSK